jgi:23S rRNA (guanosine2251-2'-O)-methyltransferase
LKTHFLKKSVDSLGRLSVQAFKSASKIPVVVVLDNLRSLHNVGSVFRTSDAFSIERLLLCGITATPPHKELRKTALGATESVAWEYAASTADVISDLKKEGFQIVAVEQAEHSVTLETFSPKADEKYALIFGHEVNGVDQEVLNQCDTVIEIAQSGTKHSLNVSVSAGVVLWYFHTALRA